MHRERWVDIHITGGSESTQNTYRYEGEEEEYLRVARNLNFKHAGNVTVDAGLSGTGKYRVAQTCSRCQCTKLLHGHE